MRKGKTLSLQLIHFVLFICFFKKWSLEMKKKKNNNNHNEIELVEKGVSVTYNVFESLELGYHLNQEDGFFFFFFFLETTIKTFNLKISKFQKKKKKRIPPIVNYLDEKMIEYLEATESPKRNLQDFQDPRVHACIYFLPPNGHSYYFLSLISFLFLIIIFLKQNFN